MLSFSPFSRKDRDTEIAAGISNGPLQSQLASRKGPRSLKRWLSMRKISQEYGSNSRKQRHSNTGIPPYKEKNTGVSSNNVCSRAGANATEYKPIKLVVDTFTSYLPPVLTSCGDANWSDNDEPLLSLLQHGFDTPARSPTQIKAPPPSTDDEDMLCSNRVVTFSNKTRTRPNPISNSGGIRGDGAIVKKSPKPKSQPPRRKRSLIYAMYCTAQTDDTSVPTSTRHRPCKPDVLAHDQREAALAVADNFLHGVPLHDSVPSLATTENMSTAFFSCQSMTSLTNKRDTDTAKRTENALGIEMADECHGSVHIDKEVLDIGDFSALEDEDMFVGPTRFEESCMASLAEVDSTVPSIASSSGSSRSSLAEELPIVEASAYRCSNRYAPRLSTIERAHDGRLRIRPSSICVQRDDSAKASPINDSTAETSSTIEGTSGSSETATEGGTCQSENNVEKGSVSVLPPDVLISSNNTARTTASASAYTGSQVSVCGSPMHGATKLYLVPFRLNGLRPISAIVTPPESPEKASTMTANASPGSSVIGGGVHTEFNSKLKPANMPDEARKKHYSSDDCDLAQHWVRSFSYMRRQTELALVNTRRSHSYDGNYVPAKRIHTRPSAPPVILQAVKLSVLPECQHPSMRPPTQANPHPDRRSLLFDGDCDFEGIADGISGSMASVVSRAHYAPGHIDTVGNGYVGEGCSDTDDIDGDIPLADILEHSQATMVSPPALVDVINTAVAKKTKEHTDKENRPTQSPVVSDKARWYTSALAKAAQLDGFRHLNFKIKASATPKTSSGRRNPVNGSDNRIERRRRGRSNSNENDGSPAPTAAAAVSAVANTNISTAKMHDMLAREQRIKTFRFNEAVAVYETWDRDAYDRKGMPLIRLDADQLETIKEELNDFKMNEMYVHEESRANTHIIC